MWLSSKQIEELGLYGGLQGASEFNRNFLKTQNWIFFWVSQENDLTYGSKEVFVRGDYAAEHGLIFPFIMRRPELASAGVYMNASAGKKFYDLFNHQFVESRNGIDELGPTSETQRIELLTDSTWRNGLNTGDFYELYQPLFEEFRNSLIDYMFTVDDYQALVATKVAAHLSALRASNKSLYVAQMSLLLTATFRPTVLTEMLIRKILEEAGLPSKYEMRVPVAVPRESMEINPKNCWSLLKGN